MHGFFLKLERAASQNKILYLFLGIWLVINLLQAFFTGLAHDEAYYWMYSRNLAWGYFDHPPMVAVLIKVGYALFPNELGVRLLFVLLGTLSLYNVYKITEGRNAVLFIACSSTIILVNAHVAGFFALPDIPLIFFTTLFLRLYKNFLQYNTTGTAIALGLVSAAMTYSKYHAVIIVFFALLAVPKVFLRWRLYMAGIIAAVLLIPHVWWQYNNGFPSFTYHLVSRSLPYDINYTANYLYSCILTAGPLVGIFLIYAAFRFNARNDFDKVLKYIFIGFYIFFFFMTFKGRVEAHWMAASLIPLIVLAYKYIGHKQKLKRLLYALVLPSYILLIVVRIALVTNFLPDKLGLHTELHHWDDWAHEIDSIAQGRNVVFVNKFQYPSKYTFYTGNFATSLNAIDYRKNQFDLWHFEDSLQNKPAVLTRTSAPDDSVQCSNGKLVKYQVVDSFTSYFNSVNIVPQTRKLIANKGDSILVSIQVVSTVSRILDFSKPNNTNNYLVYTVFNKSGNIKDTFRVQTLNHSILLPNDTLRYNLLLPPFSKTGSYEASISIQTKGLLPAMNGPLMDITVK